MKKFLKRVSRGIRKGLRNTTRRFKKIFRGGANAPPVVPPAPPGSPSSTQPLNAATPTPAPKSRRHRRAKRGIIRRATNAVRRVGKRFRNTMVSVFSRKSKKSRRRRRVQRGSSENAVQLPSGSIPATSPGIPPAPPS